MNNPKSLLAFPLFCLNKLGCLTEKKLSNITILIIVITVGLVLFDYILIILQFFYIKNSIEHNAKNFDGVGVLTQCIAKWSLCIYNRNKFINLIKYTDHFWNEKDCLNMTSKRKIEKLSIRIVFAQKFQIASIMLAGVLGCMASAYTKELFCGYWGMERKILFNCVWISLLFDIHLVAFFVAAFDCLFLGFCYEAVVQCKILYSRLEELSGKEINEEYNLKNYLNEMQSCIKHHVVLLRFHAKLQKTFSIPLMVIYVTITSHIIVQMYTVSVVSSTNSLMYSFITIPCAMLQISLYCLAANHLTHELSAIGDAVYNLNWYSHHFSTLRASIVLMIQRAQQDAVLTGCGLIKFNIETLLKILQFAVSTGVAVRKFKNKD